MRFVVALCGSKVATQVCQDCRDIGVLRAFVLRQLFHRLGAGLHRRFEVPGFGVQTCPPVEVVAVLFARASQPRKQRFDVSGPHLCVIESPSFTVQRHQRGGAADCGLRRFVTLRQPKRLLEIAEGIVVLTQDDVGAPANQQAFGFEFGQLGPVAPVRSRLVLFARRCGVRRA